MAVRLRSRAGPGRHHHHSVPAYADVIWADGRAEPQRAARQQQHLRRLTTCRDAEQLELANDGRVRDVESAQQSSAAATVVGLTDQPCCARRTAEGGCPHLVHGTASNESGLIAGDKAASVPRKFSRPAYTLKEDPQPQVLFTFGFSNLKPAPSNVST